eukprot:4962952-Pleurochrysis_carterae.AAC.1
MRDWDGRRGLWPPVSMPLRPSPGPRVGAASRRSRDDTPSLASRTGGWVDPMLTSTPRRGAFRPPPSPSPLKSALAIRPFAHCLAFVA